MIRPSLSPRFGHTFLVRDSEGMEAVSGVAAQKIYKELKEKSAYLYPDVIPHSSTSSSTDLVSLIDLMMAKSKLGMDDDKPVSLFPERLIFTGAEACAREQLVRQMLDGEGKQDSFDKKLNSLIEKDVLSEKDVEKFKKYCESSLDSLDAFDTALINDPETTTVTVNTDGTVDLSGGPTPYPDIFPQGKKWVDAAQQLEELQKSQEAPISDDLPQAVKEAFLKARKSTITTWEKLMARFNPQSDS